MRGSEAPEFTIENMTLKARLSDNIDLDEVAASCVGVEYDPEKIAHARFSLRKPKATVLLHKNGKLICMGVKSVAEGQKAIQVVVDTLNKHHHFGSIMIRMKPQLTNVVAVIDADSPLDLDLLTQKFEVVNYDPVAFAGLIVKMNGSATAILYGSGKIVFTGVDSVERMREFVNLVWQKVRSFSEGANIARIEQN